MEKMQKCKKNMFFFPKALAEALDFGHFVAEASAEASAKASFF
jgi:hypothetical protein